MRGSFGAIAFTLLLSLPANAAAQRPDSTYQKALALELPTLPPPVAVHYSPGYGDRAAALQRGARALHDLLRDSLGLDAPDVTLLVLDSADWSEAAELPYGLHTLLQDPPAFLAPAEVDRGIYHDADLGGREAELGADIVGLHYLAHFYAAEALYEDGHAADPAVKWLDELFTLMLQEELLRAVDPALAAAAAGQEAESLRLDDPAVTTLAGFDREYRRAFITREGADDYAWFLARLADWAREIRREHGLRVMGAVREALARAPAVAEPEAGLDLLARVGIDVSRATGTQDAAAVVSTAPLAARQPCRILEVGVAINDELAKGETHCYELQLAAGDSALVTAEQLSTFFPNNLLIRWIVPTGDTIARKANRQLVREVASFVAPRTGTHRVEVTRLEHRQGPETGPYDIRLEAVLDAAERRQRQAALAADPRVAWLEEHMSPLRSIDPDDEDFSDLMPLAGALDGVRVVALGEATHGSGAAFLAKTRVLKFLHQVMGFDVLVWESSVYSMRKASDHLKSGGGAAESLRRGVFDIWLDSDQMHPLMAYLDRTTRAGRPMELAGVDFQFSGTAPASSFMDDLRAYLATIGESRPALAVDDVAEVLGHLFGYRYASGDEPLPGDAVRGRVLARLQEWEQAAGRDPSADGTFWAQVLWNTRRRVENVLDRAALRAREDATDQEWERVAGVRDRVMGQNLEWLARELYPDRKIVVWAATGHLLENPDGIVHARTGETNPVYDRGYGLNPTLGHEAGLDLGNELYVLAVTARSGRHGKETWIGYPYHLQPDQVEEFELEDLIAATGVEYGLLDLRRRRAGDTWLDRPLIGRGVDRYIPWRAAWRQHLDGLLFVREMTPSTTGGTGIER